MFMRATKTFWAFYTIKVAREENFDFPSLKKYNV